VKHIIIVFFAVPSWNGKLPVVGKKHDLKCQRVGEGKEEVDDCLKNISASHLVDVAYKNPETIDFFLHQL